MKTHDISIVPADPVTREVRRAKIAVAEKSGFDVARMIRALQELQEKDQCEQAAAANGR